MDKREEMELTSEGLFRWFEQKGFASSLWGEYNEHTDVLIDGTYDLEVLASTIARALSQARSQAYEEASRLLEAMASTYLPGGPMDAKSGLRMGAEAIRQHSQKGGENE